MKRLLVGVLVGMTLCAPSLWALRVERPPEFHTWDSNTFSQLNGTLLGFWNLSNGLFQLNLTTSDPDGSRRGKLGEMVQWTTGDGAFCLNVDGVKNWNCVALSP